MIEVPAAALIAEALAGEVDFFSIGTNDLIQYTLAVDRGNENVAPLYLPMHPAVLRLVAQVLQVGEKCELPVGICGEMAGEPIYTALLLGMGLREFSMAAAMIPEVKKIIRSVSEAECRELWAAVQEMADPGEVVRYLTQKTNEILPGAVPQTVEVAEGVVARIPRQNGLTKR